MDIHTYVDSLFSEYQSNASMLDFKEEICTNLQERINYLIKNGLSNEAAFKKATSELGDISEIADQISSRKRRDVIESMYMKTKNYIDKWHAIGYVLFAGILAIGLILALLTYLASGSIIGGIGSLAPFFALPACGLLFLGLTQETARNYPMTRWRALFYSASVFVILAGLIVSTLAFLTNSAKNQLIASLGSLMTLVIPGLMILGFLLLTEKSRNKPWLIDQAQTLAKTASEPFSNPIIATKFGLYSGAIWILAVALFIVLGFLIGFLYSWIIFLFATAAQILVLASMMHQDKK